MRAPVPVRILVAGLGALALFASLAGCGVSNALGSAVLAPLSVLGDTDVALETNLQTASQAGVVQTGLGNVSGSEENGGVPETSGAPSSAGVVSVASATGVSVYTAFNPVDRHCLGTFVLASGSADTVLGQSAPGSYDFWFETNTSSGCTASIFVSEMTVPSGWDTGDPSSTGWPGI
jgi:hypothetical protein